MPAEPASRARESDASSPAGGAGSLVPDVALHPLVVDAVGLLPRAGRPDHDVAAVDTEVLERSANGRFVARFADEVLVHDLVRLDAEVVTELPPTLLEFVA